MENKTYGLFDIDSLLYRAIDKCVNRDEVREMFKIHKDKNIVQEKVLDVAYDNLLQILADIDLYAERDEGIQIHKYIYYLTYCPYSVRKKIDPTYKAHRTKNIWVDRFRIHLISKDNSEFNCHNNFRYEADDMIADKAMDFREKNIDFVIFSADKDLDQIGGRIFDIYVEKIEGEYKETITIEEYKSDWQRYQKENKIKKEKHVVHLFDPLYKSRGLKVIEYDEALNFLLSQMIVGDSTDNIVGLYKKGPAYVKKIFSDNPTYNAQEVVDQYFIHYEGKVKYKKELHKTWRLVRLGDKVPPHMELINEIIMEAEVSKMIASSYK